MPSASRRYCITHRGYCVVGRFGDVKTRARSPLEVTTKPRVTGGKRHVQNTANVKARPEIRRKRISKRYYRYHYHHAVECGCHECQARKLNNIFIAHHARRVTSYCVSTTSRRFIEYFITIHA